MLKKYKNEIFNLIKEYGLSIDKFEINENKENELVSVVSVVESPFDFFIRNSSESYSAFECWWICFGPKYASSSVYPENNYFSFDTIKSYFKEWLYNHVEPYFQEKAEIDLWDQYKNDTKLLNLEKIDFNDKANFSFDEKSQISLALGDLKLLIERKFDLDDQQKSIVNDRLNYLASAVDRLNKFDWKSIAVSTMFSIAIALSLDTQKGHELFNLFAQVFNVIPQLLIAATTP